MTGRTLLIILILAATIFSASRVIFSGSRDGVQVFDKYDLENGHYAVVGTTWANRGNKIQKELGDFYTDDIKILSELKRKWITGEPSPFFACGYHYIIHVLKDGAEVDSFALNLEKGCNTIVMDRGQYYFDPDKLGSFIGRLVRTGESSVYWARYETLRLKRCGGSLNRHWAPIKWTHFIHEAEFTSHDSLNRLH